MNPARRSTIIDTGLAFSHLTGVICKRYSAMTFSNKPNADLRRAIKHFGNRCCELALQNCLEEMESQTALHLKVSVSH